VTSGALFAGSLWVSAAPMPCRGTRRKRRPPIRTSLQSGKDGRSGCADSQNSQRRVRKAEVGADPAVSLLEASPSIAEQTRSAQIRSSADRISADQFGRSVERTSNPTNRCLASPSRSLTRPFSFFRSPRKVTSRPSSLDWGNSWR